LIFDKVTDKTKLALFYHPQCIMPPGIIRCRFWDTFIAYCCTKHFR